MAHGQNVAVNESRGQLSVTAAMWFTGDDVTKPQENYDKGARCRSPDFLIWPSELEEKLLLTSNKCLYFINFYDSFQKTAEHSRTYMTLILL